VLRRPKPQKLNKIALSFSVSLSFMKEIQRINLPIANTKLLIRTACVLLFWLPAVFPITYAQAQEFPYVGVAVGQDINVRSGQSKNFEAVAQLKEGEKVVVVGKEYSWYEIKLPVQAKSYVSADFILQMRDHVGRVTGDRVNIRSRKDLGATILGRLNKNDLVRIRSTSDQWIEIEPIEQSFGWVHEDFIAFYSKDLPPARVVELPTRNIYKRKRREQRQKAQEIKVETITHIVKAKAPKLPPKPPEAKKEPEPKAEQKKFIKITGVIRPLGDRSITQNIRHQVKAEDDQTYYLKGYRSIIDTFLNYKVHIEAELLSDIQAPAPVVLVRKIELIL